MAEEFDKSPLAPHLAERTSKIEQYTKILGAIQSTVTLIVGIVGFITASGYITVNMNLNQFTSIQGFNIDPRKYFAAGLGLLFLIILAYVVTSMFMIFPKDKSARAWKVFLVLCGLGGIVAIYRIVELAQNEANSVNQVNINYYLYSDFTILIALSCATLIRLLISRIENPRSGDYWIPDLNISIIALAVFYTVCGGSFYGNSFYRSLPQALGGGKPINVTIIFGEEKSVAPLSIPRSPSNNLQSSEVLLLAPLTDGLLFLEPNTGYAFAVKNVAILGLRENRISPFFNALLTQVPIQSTAFTPTASLTPFPSTQTPTTQLP